MTVHSNERNMKVVVLSVFLGALCVAAFPQPADDAVKFGEEAPIPVVDVRQKSAEGERSGPVVAADAEEAKEAEEEDEAGNRFFGWGLGSLLGGGHGFGGGWGNYGGYYGRRHHHHHGHGFGGHGFGGHGFGGNGFGFGR